MQSKANHSMDNKSISLAVDARLHGGVIHRGVLVLCATLKQDQVLLLITGVSETVRGKYNNIDYTSKANAAYICEEDIYFRFSINTGKETEEGEGKGINHHQSCTFVTTGCNHCVVSATSYAPNLHEFCWLFCSFSSCSRGDMLL